MHVILSRIGEVGGGLPGVTRNYPDQAQKQSAASHFCVEELIVHEPVSVIMTRDVVSVDMEDTIEQVEAVMSSRNFSFVPVGDAKGDIFGIITAQQVEHFRTAKTNPKQVKAWELCTYKPLQVEPNASVVEVAKLMVRNNIDYVVVTENRAIKGVVSSLDIVRQYVLKENV